MSKIEKLGSKVQIIAHKKVFYTISLVLIVIGILSMIFRGFNLDIDFTGGTSMTIEMGQSLDRETLNDISDVVEDAIGFAPSVVQKSGDSDSSVIVKTKEIDSETRDKMFAAVKEKYNLEAENPTATDNVSATVGADIRNNAVLAVSIASLLMLIYIWIRFELTSGLAAVVTLLHDVLIMLTAYSLFQIPMNTNFIAAVLTIVGYSINATIIVFDRVRENRKISRKESFETTAERSIWQSATRSVNTTLTTLFTIVMVFIFGVDSVRNFALPLIIGILTGLYSCLFLSTSLWTSFRKMKIGKRGKVS